VAPRTGTGELYAVQVSELWSGLAGTLSRLEALAQDPLRLDEDEQYESLRRLQYALHRASEDAYGLAPPPGAETVHSELAAALAAARDATGGIVDALGDGGPEAATPLLYEWRGALFRVRLARLRLAAPSPDASENPADARPSLRAPLFAVALVFVGLTTFVAGAVIGPWPIWVAGMLAVCASFLAYRP
jgi:hypothetical protein